MHQVNIYVFGGCFGNNGPGAWAAILEHLGIERLISGSENPTTHLRMQLTATVEALSILKKPCIVHIHTDSEYISKGLTQWVNNWAANNWETNDKKPIVNRDLWARVLELLDIHHIKCVRPTGKEHLERFAVCRDIVYTKVKQMKGEAA